MNGWTVPMQWTRVMDGVVWCGMVWCGVEKYGMKILLTL